MPWACLYMASLASCLSRRISAVLRWASAVSISVHLAKVTEPPAKLVRQVRAGSPPFINVQVRLLSGLGRPPSILFNGVFPVYSTAYCLRDRIVYTSSLLLASPTDWTLKVLLETVGKRQIDRADYRIPGSVPVSWRRVRTAVTKAAATSAHVHCAAVARAVCRTANEHALATRANGHYAILPGRQSQPNCSDAIWNNRSLLRRMQMHQGSAGSCVRIAVCM